MRGENPTAMSTLGAAATVAIVTLTIAFGVALSADAPSAQSANNPAVAPETPAAVTTLNNHEVEGILGRMPPDAAYLNVGLSEANGHEAIRATITPFLTAATAVRWTITHIAESADGVVLTERVDLFEMGDKSLSVPVMGAFEFEGEMIKAWRDYFDSERSLKDAIKRLD